MRVLIAGGGIGGLALAALLARAGIDCRVAERGESNGHHGFSLGLWGNGQRVLRELGLGAAFNAAAIPFDRFEIRTDEGREVYSLDLRPLAREGNRYAHVRRADLIGWLSETVSPGMVSFGSGVVSARTVGAFAEATFGDGTRETFDLIVGADGAGSKVRESAFGPGARSSGIWRAWYAWVDARFASVGTVTQYVAPGASATVFNEGARALAVLSAAASGGSSDGGETGDQVAELFLGHPKIFEILRGVLPGDFQRTDFSEVHVGYPAVGRVVLLGDAWHGLEPFAGLGASMALEDAQVLAEELTSGVSVETALARYAARRSPRIRLARKLTRRARRWALTCSAAGRAAMNLAARFFPPSFFLGGYRRLLRELP